MRGRIMSSLIVQNTVNEGRNYEHTNNIEYRFRKNSAVFQFSKSFY